MKRFDAVIAGGGPAGSSAAILLARAGWNVAIVEKARFPRRKVCGEYISGAAWPLLDELGVAASLAGRAGPAVQRVGLFAADAVLDAPMPHSAQRAGRAIGREHLDTTLFERAVAAGATPFQPAALRRVAKRADGFECEIDGHEPVSARVVIGAHGAWEPGELPTQPPRPSARAHDLLGFKAHFRGARLPPDLMPLVVFPGAYGGLVGSDDARVSFSCCIRRDALASSRAAHPRLRAGDALLAQAMRSNRGLRHALEGARLEGAWLSAGPIRPAIRAFERGGVYAAGNAAGEAHPIVAEGISMAIQSAFLLCEALLDRPRDAARAYEAQWRANFAARVHAAALFARILMNPIAGRAGVELLARLPAVLTYGAQWSGKSRPLRRTLAPRA